MISLVLTARSETNRGTGNHALVELNVRAIERYWRQMRLVEEGKATARSSDDPAVAVTGELNGEGEPIRKALVRQWEDRRPCWFDLPSSITWEALAEEGSFDGFFEALGRSEGMAAAIAH